MILSFFFSNVFLFVWLFVWLVFGCLVVFCLLVLAGTDYEDEMKKEEEKMEKTTINKKETIDLNDIPSVITYIFPDLKE